MSTSSYPPHLILPKSDPWGKSWFNLWKMMFEIHDCPSIILNFINAKLPIKEAKEYEVLGTVKSTLFFLSPLGLVPFGIQISFMQLHFRSEHAVYKDYIYHKKLQSIDGCGFVEAFTNNF